MMPGAGMIIDALAGLTDKRLNMVLKQGPSGRHHNKIRRLTEGDERLAGQGVTFQSMHLAR